MAYQDYLEKECKTQKNQMKAKLLAWGGALDLCSRKQEELKKVEKLHEEQKKIWGTNKSAAGMRTMKKLDENYEMEIERLQKEIGSILEKKEETDRLLLDLAGEEQHFVMLRYEKGFGFDYISLKMHMSRATLFRLQDRILQKLIERENETL